MVRYSRSILRARYCFLYIKQIEPRIEKREYENRAGWSRESSKRDLRIEKRNLRIEQKNPRIEQMDPSIDRLGSKNWEKGIREMGNMEMSNMTPCIDRLGDPRVNEMDSRFDQEWSENPFLQGILDPPFTQYTGRECSNTQGPLFFQGRALFRYCNIGRCNIGNIDLGIHVGDTLGTFLEGNVSNTKGPLFKYYWVNVSPNILPNIAIYWVDGGSKIPLQKWILGSFILGRLSNPSLWLLGPPKKFPQIYIAQYCNIWKKYLKKVRWVYIALY